MGNIKPSANSCEAQPDSTPRDIVLAGAFAAFTVDLLIYPLDTVKTRIQSKDYKKFYAGKENRASLWKGLYQGVGSVIFSTLPSSAAFFTTYEYSKSLLNYSFPNLLPEPAIHSASSSIAELVSCAILTPAEVLKQHAQTLRNKPQLKVSIGFGGKRPIVAGVVAESTSLQALVKFTSHPRDLFRGYFALVGRNLPFTALQFPLYEHLKKSFTQGRQIKYDIAKTVQVNMIASAIAGSVAAIVTTPVDVMKTRVMLAANAGEKGGEKEKWQVVGGKSIGKRPPGVYKAALTEILKEDGFKGLWRGVGLRGLWSGLGLAVYLGTYEGGKVYLRRDSQFEED
ncbi:mitochondrial carrier [Terfezia boudieri ATCC MYA-4762]|uniref:Mitochondrial carrier n=1 Tax=Terfezia boudieri ATCC MYA-4762 TaxID=1051890 RepID=A0A3N4M4U8_9PEZI|nr:mitochondrial carrier [Terfezia boudieri ATCC MYA-4762]